MDQALPWTRLLGLAHTSRSDCPPARLECLLRIYLVQSWFGLSDHGVETALHDSLSIRSFAGLDDGIILPPNEREIRDFRDRMGREGIKKAVKAMVHQYLLANRYFLREGSRIDPVLGRYDEHTGYFGRLAAQFEAMSRPYQLRDILRFNAIYREVFDVLNAAEKQRAEHFVERLIDGVACPSYVPKILGVV
jgi:IS5 family transposase